MLNFGASKPRVKRGPGPPPPGSAPDDTCVFKWNFTCRFLYITCATALHVKYLFFTYADNYIGILIVYTQKIILYLIQ